MSKRNDLMTTEETALYVRLSPRTLERYRVTGQGPTYLKNGRRVLYRQADLDQWLENNRRRSTSGPRTGAKAEVEEDGATVEEPDPASPVGPRFGAAEQLNAAVAARPAGVSPRFADGGARRFVPIVELRLAKC